MSQVRFRLTNRFFEKRPEFRKHERSLFTKRLVYDFMIRSQKFPKMPQVQSQQSRSQFHITINNHSYNQIGRAKFCLLTC